MTSGGMTGFIWKNRIAWLVVVVVVGVVLDQASKLWALDALTRPATAKELACDEPEAKQRLKTLQTESRNMKLKLKRPPSRVELGALLGMAVAEVDEAFACVGSARVEEHGKRVVLRTIDVVDGFFSFKYAENPAAAFSMTGSLPVGFRRPFLLLVSLLASIGITFWYTRLKDPDWAIFTAFPMIIAGAVGNLIDRARLAYVIDFLDVYLSAPTSAATWLAHHFRTNHWPTFNIADSCIVVGALLVVFRTIKPAKKVTTPVETDKPA